MSNIQEFQEATGHKLQTKYILCPRCLGTGQHVNPAIDGNGLSDERADDHEFMAEYVTGTYDVICEACNGLRVVKEIDRSASPQAVVEDWDEWCRSEAETTAIYAAERRLGA
jgi:hypothetical protein